jgi:hypothetical protein
MAWLLVAAGLTYVGAAAVTLPDRVTPANFSGYASGSALHVHAIQAGLAGPRLVDTDVAPAGASVNTAGLPNTLDNELGEPVQPANVSGKKASGIGNGLQLGIGSSVPNDPNAAQLILSGQAEATASPDTPFVPCPPNNATCQDLGPIQGDPVAYASLLRGEAEAHMDNLLSRCPTPPPDTTPFGRGRGYAADVQLLNTGTTNADGTFNPPLIGTDTPGQNAVDVKTRTYPINNGDGTFGLVSEVSELLVPVRLAGQLTIQLAGEWVLRATVTGKPGGAKIEYAPAGSPSNTTPVITILQGVTQLLQVTLQQLLGQTGLSLPANPLLDLAIGEAPRAIGGANGSAPTSSANGNSDGTTASAAVDVVRLIALTGATNIADTRIGHMEVSAKVPPGGFSFNDCGQLRVSKNVVGPVTGPFTFHVVCAGVTLLPSETDFTLAAGASKTIPVPTGKQCTVTEPGKGNASSTSISESPPGSAATGTSNTDGVVTIPAAMNTVSVGFTNVNEGQISVTKTAQAGVTGTFTFASTCTPAASTVPATFTLAANETRTFGQIAGGTTCTFTETNPGNAAVTRITDSTAPNNDGAVTVVGGATQSVVFSNAGPPLVIAKVATGDSAGKGPFTFHLVCKDTAGATVALDAADTDFTLNGGEQHQIRRDIPDGSTCVVTETGNGQATSTVPTDTSGVGSDATVVVMHGETQAVTFTNNFVAPIKLIVSKTVVGNGSGPFAFHVVCTAPGGAAVALAAADADFSLIKDGSHGIKSIPNGSTCTVTETDSKGAVRTINDSSGTAGDGVVTIPVDGAATVKVTNTFVAPIVEPPIVVAPRTVG